MTVLGSRVRVRPWAFDGDVVQLSLADQAIVPDVDEVGGWVDALTSSGVERSRLLRSIRTGALFAEAAERFAAAGFDVIDTLALLRIDLAGRPRRVVRSLDGDDCLARSKTHSLGLSLGSHSRSPTSTSRLPTRRHAEAAEVDRDAFGDPWGNDADDLAEIRRATPVHRARARFVPGPGRRRTLVGFAITGAAAGHGYLQRLAVSPGHQRHGHGRALVLDSLAWMGGRRLGHGLVNTAVGNERALGLYESLGFQQLPERLVVMQLDLAAAGGAGR